MHRVITLAFALVLPSLALAGDEDPASKAAWKLLEDGKVAEAQAAYKQLTKADADNGQHWFMLGYAYHAGGDYKKALKAYAEGLDTGAYVPLTEYNIACAYSLLGDADQAFAHLDASMEAGFGDVAQLESDTDLTALHTDPRWAGVLTRAAEIGSPCKSDPAMAQLDFWLGSWKVTSADGKPVGKNTIEKVHNDCMIVEHWTGSNRVSGTSMSFYDPGEEQWVQLWRGDRGGIGRFAGGLDGDGAMVLTGTWTNMDGTTSLTRGTWTPHEDGTVSQRFESSSDEGATWKTTIDLTYRPIPDAADGAAYMSGR